MTQVLGWRSASRPNGLLRQAAAALVGGQLVAFPTETVYGVAASALVPEALDRLRQSKGRPEEKPLTLAIRGVAEALDWVPAMSPLGRRLARRCWPGPVTLVFGGADQGLASRLPESVRQNLCPQGTLGLRVPAHDAILEVMRLLPAPLVLSSANRSGEPAATTAEQVVAAVGADLALVVDDGPSRYGQASTVVQVDGHRWHLLREGVVPAAELQRLTPCVIVFVCTGNTCRSPLAEALCKKLLAERLGCTPADLPERGFIVLSAGVAAMMGGRATTEAFEAARELGADLSGHVSRPLSAQVAAQADYLIAMTQSQLHAVNQQCRIPGCQPRLLSAAGEDLADPIGGDQPAYQECARQILRHLEGFVAELQPS